MQQCAHAATDVWEIKWSNGNSTDACEQWASNSEWGALFQFANLDAACSDSWAERNCASTCCSLAPRCPRLREHGIDGTTVDWIAAAAPCVAAILLSLAVVVTIIRLFEPVLARLENALPTTACYTLCRARACSDVLWTATPVLSTGPPAKPCPCTDVDKVDDCVVDPSTISKPQSAGARPSHPLHHPAPACFHALPPRPPVVSL